MGSLGLLVMELLLHGFILRLLNLVYSFEGLLWLYVLGGLFMGVVKT